MLQSENPCGSHITLLGVLLAFMGLCAVNTQAQEVPSSGRIVEGRPGLYTFKNAVNLLTWVEWGVEPLFRSAERGWIRRMASYLHRTQAFRVRHPCRRHDGLVHRPVCFRTPPGPEHPQTRQPDGSEPVETGCEPARRCTHPHLWSIADLE